MASVRKAQERVTFGQLESVSDVRHVETPLDGSLVLLSRDGLHRIGQRPKALVSEGRHCIQSWTGVVRGRGVVDAMKVCRAIVPRMVKRGINERSGGRSCVVNEVPVDSVICLDKRGLQAMLGCEFDADCCRFELWKF